MPGTLREDKLAGSSTELQGTRVRTYGSAIRRSVSLMMRLGSAMVALLFSRSLVLPAALGPMLVGE